MRIAPIVSIAVVCAAVGYAAADDAAPARIDPEDARNHVGEHVEVVFEVLASKHSARRMTVFLDSKEDFHDEDNLGVSILQQGIDALKEERQIEAPADFYRGKTIRVVGVVVLRDERVYIDVTAADQIELAEPETEPEPE